MRCDYLMATLNPDDPDCRFTKNLLIIAVHFCLGGRHAKGNLGQLCQPEKPGWVHWFFSLSII